MLAGPRTLFGHGEQMPAILVGTAVAKLHLELIGDQGMRKLQIRYRSFPGRLQP